MVRCIQIDFDKEGAAPAAAVPAAVAAEKSPSRSPSPERRFPKFINTYEEAYEVAKQVLKEIGESAAPGELGGLSVLPPEVQAGPWAITKDAAKRTLKYMYKTIYHTCYMLAIIGGTRHLIKLEPLGEDTQVVKGVPNHYGRIIKQTLDTSTDKRWNRFKGKQLRVMQCVLKTRRDEATFSTQYDRWIRNMPVALPDGLFILNLTDAVILRKDGRKPWEPAGEEVELEKYLPILGGSGSEGCWDIPMPNYDDIMIVLGEQKVDTFTTSWSEKKGKAVFRGGFTGCGTTGATNMRIALGEMPPSSDFDVKLVGHPSNNPRFDPVKGLSFVQTTAQATDQKMSKAQQSTFKYILHVDGNVAAYRLLEFMKMGSVIIKVQGGYKLWFEHLLRDQKNMLLVDADVEKVKEAVTWCKDNDSACKKIAKRCKELADMMLNKDFIDATFSNMLWALVGKQSPSRSASPEAPAPAPKAATPPPKVATPPPKLPTPPKAAAPKLTAKEMLALRRAQAAAAAGQKGGRTRRLRKRTRKSKKRTTRRR